MHLGYGTRFLHGLLRWSVRMLQYREPTVEQKTRMLQLAAACAARLLVEAGSLAPVLVIYILVF